MTSQTTISVGIYWKPGVWDLARSAYLADLDTDADSPGSFVGWLAQMLILTLVGVTAVRVGAGRMRIDQAFIFFLKWPLALAFVSVLVAALFTTGGVL